MDGSNRRLVALNAVIGAQIAAVDVPTTSVSTPIIPDSEPLYGAGIVTVQKLMGHANVTTTADHNRRDAKAKRPAVNKLHIAWKRQTKD